VDRQRVCAGGCLKADVEQSVKVGCVLPIHCPPALAVRPEYRLGWPTGRALHRPGIQAFEPQLLEGKALAAANISQGQHRRSRLMTTIALVAGGGQ
jgi:hypothetical protein